MSSLRRKGTNHHSPLSAEWAGPPVTLCAGVPSRVSSKASWGGLCRKLPWCLWAEPGGPETAPTEGTAHKKPSLHPSGRPLLCLAFLFCGRGKRVQKNQTRAEEKHNHPNREGQRTQENKGILRRWALECQNSFCSLALVHQRGSEKEGGKVTGPPLTGGSTMPGSDWWEFPLI